MTRKKTKQNKKEKEMEMYSINNQGKLVLGNIFIRILKNKIYK